MKICGHLLKMLIVSLSLSFFCGLVYLLSVPQVACAVYIGCFTRIMTCFGSVCSGLIYVDVTKIPYVRNWPVTMILTREMYGLLSVTGTVPI